jgi:3-oxoacyl-[acyl-carrier-protein] reductase
MKLKEKIALVTGGAKGIGRAISLKLAAEGAYVIVNYSASGDSANRTVDDIKAAGGQAEAYKCNVAVSSDVKCMVDYILKKHTKIDILVNNAGITRDNLLMAMSEDDFDIVNAVNLKGCFNCMQAVCRAMIKARKGRIINISSVSGIAGNAGQVNYSASKAGIIGMTKSAAKELASRNITVNALAPGFVVSEMTDVLSDKVKESIKESIPMKTFGNVDDIANAAAFFAGDEAGYITGQTLCIDGGMTCF